MSSADTTPLPTLGAGSNDRPPKGAPPETFSLYERWKRIHPLWVSGGWQTWRRVVLVILVAIYYLGPWLSWNGKPGFLFDLTHRRFTVLWATFVPEEFILLAWGLLIAALTLFTVTVAAGRLFCGWACPQTIWTLVYFTIERFVEGDRNARLRAEKSGWTRNRLVRKAIKLSLWSVVALSISITFVGYFEPIRELLPRIVTLDLSGWEQVAILGPAGASFLISGVLREQVCFHMCPYARFQSVMFDHDSLIISYEEGRGEPRGKRRRDAALVEGERGACIDCKKCVNVCPTGIDIRDGLQYQCIGCAACIDACTDVMSQMGYGESLVRYSTQNHDQGQPGKVLRPRLVGYASLVVVMVGLVSWYATHRVPVGFTIERDRARLYRVDWDGKVENSYTLRVGNRESDVREYRVEFDAPLPVVYHGPERLRVEGGALEIVPVRLTLPGSEPADSERVDVRFRIVADEPKAIVVEETTSFRLPPEDER